MKAVKVFLTSLVIFLFAFFMIEWAMLMFSSLREKTISTTQDSVYESLERDLVTSAGLVPTRFSPVQISENQYYLEDKEMYCYPRAWGKPGRVLLEKKCGNFYYLTLGDGGKAIVTYWSSYGEDDPNAKPNLLGPTNSAKYNFCNFWFVPLGAIIIAVTILLIQKEQKTKINNQNAE